MKDRPARIAASHGLAGFGRSSLTAVIPTLSAMGVQVCPIPTAVLSTHTGFGDAEIRDLTDFIQPCAAHYQKLGIAFEGVYSGFLSNASQAREVAALMAAYPEALSVVDPVMGDHGRKYRTCTPELTEAIRWLVHSADLITPNPTEAALLLGEPYSHTPFTQRQLKSMLARLAELGPRYIVITGVEMATGECASAGFDRQQNAFWKV